MSMDNNKLCVDWLTSPLDVEMVEVNCVVVVVWLAALNELVLLTKKSEMLDAGFKFGLDLDEILIV